MKHMQHTSETHKTYGYNTCSSICFRPMKVDAGAGDVVRGAGGARRDARDASSTLREARTE